MTSLTTGYCHSGWLLRLLNFGRNVIVIMVMMMMMIIIIIMIIIVFGGGGGSVVLVLVLVLRKVVSLFWSALMAFGFTSSIRTPCLFHYCYDLCQTLRRWAGA